VPLTDDRFQISQQKRVHCNHDHASSAFCTLREDSLEETISSRSCSDKSFVEGENSSTVESAVSKSVGWTEKCSPRAVMTPSVKTDREGRYSFMRHRKSVWFLAWKENERCTLSWELPIVNLICRKWVAHSSVNHTQPGTCVILFLKWVQFLKGIVQQLETKPTQAEFNNFKNQIQLIPSQNPWTSHHFHVNTGARIKTVNKKWWNQYQFAVYYHLVLSNLITVHMCSENSYSEWALLQVW